MEQWMVTEGYGKVLGRPGLDLGVRELCIVALLAVLGVPVQLYSHLRGALHAGAPPTAVDEALTVASGYMDEESRAAARSTWDRVRKRTGTD
jgi:4-carboxymuconolactone decarboxylase